MKYPRRIFGCLLFSLLTVLPLRAAVWNVTSAADANVLGTLRFAVNNSVANDRIKFDPALAGQTISLTLGELPITKNLTITGLGPTNLAIVNDLDRVFHVFNGPLNAGISGLKLTGHRKGARGTDGTVVFVDGTDGAGATGGCIQNDALCTLAVSNCFFAGGQAIGGDGGNAYTNDNYHSVANGGRGGAACGGAVFSNGDVLLMNCAFAGNFAGSGGGGYGSYGGNGGHGGTAHGGALCDVYGNTTIFLVNCTFYGNTASAGDGGNAGNAWLLAPEAANGGNGSIGGQAAGGAIFVDQGCPDDSCTGIVHCTIDGNQVAPGEGKKGGQGVNGGVIGANGANGTARGGGIYAPNAGRLPIGNTIVAANFATFHFTTGSLVFTGPDVFNDVSSFHYNFIGALDLTSSGWMPGFDFTGTVTAPLDPLLGPLQNNGGETLTQAPGPCSPVVDKGSATLFNHDQILQPRPVGITPSPYFADGSDIGAHELQSFPTNAPLLGISYATNLTTISWPAAFSCFALLQNTNLASTNWFSVANAVTLVGGQCQVVLAPTLHHQFFRLVHP